jgi:hypothetical protein
MHSASLPATAATAATAAQQDHDAIAIAVAELQRM